MHSGGASLSTGGASLRTGEASLKTGEASLKTGGASLTDGGAGNKEPRVSCILGVGVLFVNLVCRSVFS